PCRVGDRGAYRLAPDHATQPHLSHQALHRAAGNLHALAQQLQPDLAHAVHLEVLLPYAADLLAQHGVAMPACRPPFRLDLTGRVRVVGRRSDRQHPADRLDSVSAPVFVDERRHSLNRRSSSAWAKYADALRRISLAWRSSRFSRSSAFIRAGSPLVGPLPSP